ncbi:MAG: hypothetical protein LBO00_04880 [Zoogloeaceae bacterium]|jgi:hypothetical protein|nr:hypothetical protein [Zoogloeaceae bacterium]
MNFPLIIITSRKPPNHGRDDTLLKNSMRKTLEHACRAYYSAWISNNPHVSEVDRNELRVPLHSGGRAPSGRMNAKSVGACWRRRLPG